MVICVDELAELTAKTSSQREDGLRGEAVAALSQVARLGRAPGIHLILCTQRPDAEVIPGQIKSSMGAVLAFRAANEVDSQILLGQGDVGAKLLPKDVPGRAIWQGKDGDMHVQPPWLAPDEARRLVKEIERSGQLNDGKREASRRPQLCTATWSIGVGTWLTGGRSPGSPHSI